MTTSQNPIHSAVVEALQEQPLSQEGLIHNLPGYPNQAILSAIRDLESQGTLAASRFEDDILYELM